MADLERKDVIGFGIADPRLYAQCYMHLRSFTIEDYRSVESSDKSVRIRKTSCQMEWHDLKK